MTPLPFGPSRALSTPVTIPLPSFGHFPGTSRSVVLRVDVEVGFPLRQCAHILCVEFFARRAPTPRPHTCVVEESQGFPTRRLLHLKGRSQLKHRVDLSWSWPLSGARVSSVRRTTFKRPRVTLRFRPPSRASSVDKIFWLTSATFSDPMSPEEEKGHTWGRRLSRHGNGQERLRVPVNCGLHRTKCVDLWTSREGGLCTFTRSQSRRVKNVKQRRR